mmetsp:Transcript_6053/g.9898  ORF Transcript_6053/g.9898 Transcript_6053/m.9898 type:complete len:245 (-) Transcript_6053:800-1534(-)
MQSSLDIFAKKQRAGVPKSVTLSSSSSPSSSSSSSSSSTYFSLSPESSSFLESSLNTIFLLVASFLGNSALFSSASSPSVEPPLSIISDDDDDEDDSTRFTETLAACVSVAAVDRDVSVVLFEIVLPTKESASPDKGSTSANLVSTLLPGRSPEGVNPMIRAGAPTAVAPLGMARSTTLPAPILTRSPICMLPRIFVPAPINTSFPTFGCLSPFSLPVPPKVTPCNIVVPSPMTAVSPTTIPEA